MLQFRIGAIPVRIQFYFILSTLLLGPRDSGIHMALWVGVVFVSVLIHELGHAIVGKILGYDAAIELTGFVGLTFLRPREIPRGVPQAPVPELRQSPWRNILVSLSGPFAGFAFGTLIFAVSRLPSFPTTELAIWLTQELLVVNFVWGILNLFPIVPLDGGQVFSSILSMIFGAKGARFASYASIAFAGIAGLLALKAGAYFLIFLMVNTIMINVRLLRSGTEGDEGPATPVEELRALLDEGYAALGRGDGHIAITRAETILKSPRTAAALRVDAIKLLARGRLLEGHWDALMHLLEAARRELGHDELMKFEESARQLDRPEEAERIRAFAAADR